MSDVTRRSFALGSLAALGCAVPGIAADYPPGLAFAAYRNGKRIGEHRLGFERAGEALTVRTRAEMAVKIGPVTVYRYLHEVTERWVGGRFDSLESRTNGGGKREAVTAIRGAQGVLIRADGKSLVTASAATLPFTHWNIEIADSPLFNPQTGKLLKQVVRRLPPSPVLLDDGRSIQAQQIAFTGDAVIDDWYQAGALWTGLRGKLDDGSLMEYRRL